MNFQIYQEYVRIQKSNRIKMSVFEKIMMVIGLILPISFVAYALIWTNWVLLVLSLGMAAALLIMLVLDSRKWATQTKSRFNTKMEKHKSLCKALEEYRIKDRKDYVFLQDWLKEEVAVYKSRIKTAAGPITFSTVITFLCSAIPSLYSMIKSFSVELLAILFAAVLFVLIAFATYLLCYLVQYPDYMNKKYFIRDIQEILDYELYAQVQENTQNEEQKEDIQQRAVSA